MPKQKSIDARIKILDELLQDQYAKYSTDDLRTECEVRLEIENGNQPVEICCNTIRNDIKWIKERHGEDVIVSWREGKNQYYRYADPDFSIYKKALTARDVPQLTQIVSYLMRFKGLPQFEWVQDFMDKLQLDIDLDKMSDKIVGFDEMPFLKGLEFFSSLFNAIVDRKVLKVTFTDFAGDTYIFPFHPYYLKQFNKRWYVLGWNPVKGMLYNYPFDRIVSVEADKQKWIPKEETLGEDFDFTDYFSDIVGVTHFDKPMETVQLKVDRYSWNYMKTKPIHTDCEIEDTSDGGGLVTFKVIPNYELEQAILYYGEHIEVLEPLWLRDRMRQRAKAISELYK